MNAVSLLLIDYGFGGPRPLGHLVSPVATSSRKGRTPGLSAVGFSIEATVKRKVGAKGLVDHDIWVLHNTREARERVAGILAGMRSDRTVTETSVMAGSGTDTARHGWVALVGATARATVRGTRAVLRTGRSPSTLAVPVRLPQKHGRPARAPEV